MVSMSPRNSQILELDISWISAIFSQPSSFIPHLIHWTWLWYWHSGMKVTSWESHWISSLLLSHCVLVALVVVSFLTRINIILLHRYNMSFIFFLPSRESKDLDQSWWYLIFSLFFCKSLLPFFFLFFLMPIMENLKTWQHLPIGYSSYSIPCTNIQTSITR